MTLTEALKAEFQEKKESVFAPQYYKYAGFLRAREQGVETDIPTLRAYAVQALLTDVPAKIYQNDRIAGSMSPLWIAGDKEKLEEAIKTVDAIGERTFRSNADHFAPDYFMVLTRGIPGLLEDLKTSMEVHKNDPDRVKTLQEMTMALEGLRNLAANYAAKADSLIGTEGYSEENLVFIRDNCTALTQHAPETFAQALQLVWLCHLAFVFEGRNAMALGRMDQFLYPFFRKDVDEGRLTPEEAQLLLENVFIKIYERRVLSANDDVNNICIGGTSPDGSCDVNELSFLILQAVGTCNVPGPNLSARISKNTPDEFLDACLKVIGTGLGYPALMNDEVNLAALRKYGYEEEDLYNYCMVGCIENFITGKQPPWSDGRFDTPRFFEYLFNRGKGIYSDTFGVDTGDLSAIDSMENFMEKFEIQLKEGARIYIETFNKDNILPHPEDFTSPLLSCFCRECILRGKDINLGGTKYPSVHGAALMGVGTVCDSLAAIEKTVFVDKSLTLENIRDAMIADFKGYEEVRRLLEDAPKYGNNDPFADKYAVWFVDFLSDEFNKYHTYDGGGIYSAMAANINNISAGRLIGATPDGRHAGEPLSDAASPTYGKDVRGATATVNSISKPDYTRVACGSVINQKYSPSMFGDGKRSKLLALIRTYFAKGGQEIQINATSTKVLKDAMDHPEKYPNLVVRVSGFSAIYVTLSRDVQLDILSRTQKD